MPVKRLRSINIYTSLSKDQIMSRIDLIVFIVVYFLVKNIVKVKNY